MGQSQLRVLQTVRDLTESSTREASASIKGETTTATGADGPESDPLQPGVGVADLAVALDSHPNGVRRHLNTLVDTGLVDAAPVPPHGRGRPSTAYRLTPTGRSVLAGARAPVSSDYLALAAAFADHVRRTAADPTAEAHQIGRTWGQLLIARSATPRPQPRAAAATDPEEVRRTILDVLEELGFSPTLHYDGSVGLRTCPLLGAARQNAEVLCQVHLGLVQGVSEACGGPATGGSLSPFSELGACRLVLPDPLCEPVAARRGTTASGRGRKAAAVRRDDAAAPNGDREHRP